MKPRKSPIRTRRDALGLRREQVAAAAGISIQTLWLLESGRQKSTGVDIARRIASALQASVDDLFPTKEAA